MIPAFLSTRLSLPVVYRRQQQWYKSQQTAQEQLLQWKQAELQREIKLLFYAMVNALERKQLLQRLDSVYSHFQQSANLRLLSGESNVLEKTTADAQLQQLQLQQKQLNADMLILQQKLQWLLCTDKLLLPAYTAIKKESTAWEDTTAATAHPQTQYNKLQEQVAAAQTGVEKTKLSPDLSIGYSNQSVIGYHSADGIHQNYYGSATGFILPISA